MKLLLLLSSFSVQAFAQHLNYESLPLDTLFPGAWEANIRAPLNKSHIVPRRVFKTEGKISKVAAVVTDEKQHSFALGPGDLITFEFGENIGGRVCLDIKDFEPDAYITLAYSESPTFAGREPDTTTDRIERDLPLNLAINSRGQNCVGKDYNRGAFKFLTIYIPEEMPSKEHFWHIETSSPQDHALAKPRSSWYSLGQQLLGLQKSKLNSPRVSISAVWVNCSSFPSNANGRAYTGYFDSSSSLLNRIWYAGAWTLQLSTIDPNEGSALVDYNRRWDHNESPVGSWYSNFTIANGTTVTTDGAKRDRMVWPGDMTIAVPGIAVSTYDMLAARNALDTIFDHQYGDGSLPYASLPMTGGEFSDTYHLHTLLGAYNYVLYSGDIAWLKGRWAAYTKALDVSIAKVDGYGLLHVSSTYDWLRPGMTGHNLEASVILYDTILKTIVLAKILGDPGRNHKWLSTKTALEGGIEHLWCQELGFFADNIGRRGCNGSERVLPQDGNSWALLSGIVDDDRKRNISRNLRLRWGKYGAPAVEFPNVISPFAGSFELLAHCAAGNHDAAVELMELEWGYMLDGPAFTNSTCVEGYRIDGDAQYPAYWSTARNSHAHGWSTGPTTVLMQEILGIKLLSPLGETWSIKPHLTKWLSYAQGGFATKLGKFVVGITLMKTTDTGQKVEVLDVSTPNGTTGHIEWKGHVRHDIVGGKPLKLWVFLDDEDSVLYADDAEFTIHLTTDNEWVRPAVEEREPGVVDWEALKSNYVDKGHDFLT
ncbi:alpha-l-rhamnosidase a [Phlyctema vagabunda]|uniref:Alpha-l-rhamnosidase a n=1 Tax=Phlyctema vagabunda TaxID=108571 RepID=A0ABR4PJE0_9HELO